MTAVPLWVHQIILYSFAISSVTSNFFPIFLVVHPSNKTLGHYRVLLCFFAIVDVIISIFHASIIPVFHQDNYGFLLFAYNTLYLDEKIGRLLNELYCALFYQPFILLTFHFFYRFLSIIRTDALQFHFWKGFGVALVINATIELLIICDVRLAYLENKENYFADSLMSEYNIDLLQVPEPNTIPVHYIHSRAHGSGPKWNSIIATFNCGCFGFATIVFNCICGVIILRAVRNRVMSAKTRSMQLQLLRALVLQFAVPVLFGVLPLFLIIGLPVIGLHFRHSGVVLGFFVSAFPVIDPICVICVYSRQISRGSSSMLSSDNGDEQDDSSEQAHRI